MNRFFLLLLFLWGSDSLGNMKIHEHRVELFSRTAVPTEFYAYHELKRAPLLQEVSYVAVPWYQLINRNLLHTVSEIKVNGGFTICQHIKYKQIIPYVRAMGVNVLFATHAQSGERYGNLVVMPFPHYAVTGTNPAQHKDILYSFIGARTKQIREALFDMKVLENCCIIKRDGNHFTTSKEERAFFEAEYRDVLSRSRFSLCPRGTGPNTMRFWESLQAGAIPVVISDDLTLPDGVNWDECVVWISEAQFLRDSSIINRIIKKISPQKESKLRSNGLKAYRKFSAHNFVRVVRKFYGEA